ncbi:OPT oligopeptide transporter protein-domain-containing protein [Phyllosticta paracitricarpa]|uniref:OPT oligopeptide transporter protein-domain-containing protein n=1 Tax=Phyllosticta paracitricarpa TaxID=2016321 RepID=A0ABR1NAH6_9PEZI
MHELDPNFPDEVLDKVRAFLSNDDVFAQPQNHFMLIHEMKIEAALITNNSPYAEVRAVVSNTDDPTIPCLTVRATWAKMLVLGPMGKAAAKYLPGRAFTVLGKHVSLNPGPFNKKEHMLIAIMASNALDVPYTTFIGKARQSSLVRIHSLTPFNPVFSQYLPQYFNQGYAGQFGYQVLVALGTNFVGYGIAGFLRRFLVYPTYCVWPTSLVAIALNESFHSGLALPVSFLLMREVQLTVLPGGNPPVVGLKKRIYTASRLRWFTVVFVGMFMYEHVPRLPRLTNTSRTYLTHYSSFRLPNYLIQALSFFNWPTWIAPHSVHLNAMTGMRNGLGFNPLPTLDWNIPSFHYTSPLVVPFFNTTRPHRLAFNGVPQDALHGLLEQGTSTFITHLLLFTLVSHSPCLQYNYVTSAALSAGVVISAIVIFFALQYPGVALPDSWWGNHVSCEGCENPRSPCVLKPLGPGGTFGPQLGEF